MSLTGETDFVAQVKNGVLTISDKQEVKQGSQGRLGRSLDFLMDVSQSITGQYKDIQIAIPQNLALKKMKLNLANNFAGIFNIQAEQVDIQSASGFVGIYDIQLQQAQFLNKMGSIYVGNSQLRDVTIQSYDLGVSHARFQGKVNLEAEGGIHFETIEDVLAEFSYHFVAPKGEITQIPSQGGFRNYPKERALANPYTRDEQSSNQVTITSRSGSSVIVEEE